MRDSGRAGQRIAGQSLAVPARLSAAERDRLARRLFAVHGKVFSGVSYKNFCAHVIAPPAEATVIRLFLGADGGLVGYCAVHRFRRALGGRTAIVLRAEAGLLPEYRGRGATYGFGILYALVTRLAHPFRPVYYLGTLVHPSSYHLFCKYFPQVYPRPGRATPPAMATLARDLADSFADPAVTADDPFVRAVGWVTIESPQERALSGRDDREDVRFFKARNPGYIRGEGLVVVVPMTFRNLALAGLARMRERLATAVTRRRAEL